MPDTPPCAENAVEVRVRRCVNGVWVEGWLAASEIGQQSIAASDCGGCAKAKAIELAKEKGWTANELIAVLKVLK